MHIRVKCFAGCKDIVGQAEQTIEIPEATTVGAAFDHLVELYPDLDRFRRSLLLAVNTEYAGRDVILKEGDVLACIPPVSGGVRTDASMFKITTDAIKPDALHDWILKPHHGAIVTFAGTVRDNTDGRQTTRLEYEAYAEMAEIKMQEVGKEIQDKWGIEDIAMLHRVGALEIGEISILIAVAAPHRKDTFDACSYAIDRVKQVVPVWKKEIWQAGDTEWIGNRS